ncbi:MAG: DALR anticodon-binding domain-containing protein [Pseudonocardiaceae bacterium]
MTPARPTTCARLVLAKMTSNVLTLGLSLPGIDTPERM